MSKRRKPLPNAVMPQVRQISIDGIHNAFRMLGGTINNASNPHRRHDNYKIGKRSIPLPRLDKSNRKSLISEKQLQAAIRVMLGGGHSHGKIAQALNLNGATWWEKPTPNAKLIAELTKTKPTKTPEAPVPTAPDSLEYKKFQQAAAPPGHTWSELTLDDMTVLILKAEGLPVTAESALSVKQRITYRIARTRAFAALLEDGHLLRYRPTPTTPYEYRFTNHAVNVITSDFTEEGKAPTMQPDALTDPQDTQTKVATRTPNAESKPLNITAALNTLIKRHNILLTIESPSLKISLEQFIINAAAATRGDANQDDASTIADAVNELVQRHGTTVPLTGPALHFDAQQFIINLEVSTRPPGQPEPLTTEEETEEEPFDDLPF